MVTSEKPHSAVQSKKPSDRSRFTVQQPLATNCTLKNALKTTLLLLLSPFLFPTHFPTYPPTLHPLPLFSLLGDKYSCGHNQFPLLSELEAGQSGRLKCRIESRGRLVIAFFSLFKCSFHWHQDYWSTKDYYYIFYVPITSWLYIIHRPCNLNLEKRGPCITPIRYHIII